METDPGQVKFRGPSFDINIMYHHHYIGSKPDILYKKLIAMGSNGYVKCRYQLLKGFMWRDAEKNCYDTGIF